MKYSAAGGRSRHSAPKRRRLLPMNAKNMAMNMAGGGVEIDVIIQGCGTKRWFLNQIFVL